MAALAPCTKCDAPADRTHEGSETDWYVCSECSTKFGICFDEDMGGPGEATSPLYPVAANLEQNARDAAATILAAATGPEVYRVDFARPTIFGLTIGWRSIWPTALASLVVAVGAAMAHQVLLMILAATIFSGALMIGFLAGLIYLAWKKGPEYIAVCERAVVVRRGAESDILSFSTMTECVVITFGHMPRFLRLRSDGKPYQILVQSLDATKVSLLAEHIESRMCG